MAVHLSLVEELGFVRPFESGQTHRALRVIRHELTTEEDHSRVEQLPIDPQLQTIECIARVGRLAFEPPVNRGTYGPIDLLEVQDQLRYPSATWFSHRSRRLHSAAAADTPPAAYEMSCFRCAVGSAVEGVGPSVC